MANVNVTMADSSVTAKSSQPFVLSSISAYSKARGAVSWPKPRTVGFMVDKVALGEVYLPVIRFIYVTVNPQRSLFIPSRAADATQPQQLTSR
jgi:hypothetical protein